MEQAGSGEATNNVNQQPINGGQGPRAAAAVAAVVGYQPPEVECHIVEFENEIKVQRLLRNDPSITGLTVFLSSIPEDFDEHDDYDDDPFDYEVIDDEEVEDDELADDELADDDDDDDEEEEAEGDGDVDNAVDAAAPAGGDDMSIGEGINYDDDDDDDDSNDGSELMDTDDEDDFEFWRTSVGDIGHDRYVFKGEIADAIGRSKFLRTLQIDDPSAYTGFGDVSSFFKRVAENRSIEHLALVQLDYARLDIFAILAPFLEHNDNLRCVEISGLNVPKTIPSLISALTEYKTIHLERIDVSCSNLGDRCAADLINALTAMQGLCFLLDLYLAHNKIGREGSAALGRLLNSPACNIQRVILVTNDLDDECIEVLARGLMSNTTIKLLDLRNLRLITPNGWRTFSTHYLSNSICSVEEIDLGCNNIGDEGAVSLGNSMTVNNTLKLRSLDLSSHSITSAGWRGLSTGLQSSAIEEFRLCNTNIDDEGAIAIVTALASNSALKILDMEMMNSITSAGWSQCLRQLLDSEFSLEKLVVGHNNIDDEGATILVKSLVPCTSLKVLHMMNNLSISANGWMAFFRSLLDARSSAEALLLDDNNIDDEGAAMLIRLLDKTRKIGTLSLRGNDSITCDGWWRFARALKSTTLKVLRLGVSGYRDSINSKFVRRFGKALELTSNNTLEVLSLFNNDDDPEIHPRAWEALNKALCNNSSIADIVSSNHTLYEIVESEHPHYLQVDLKTASLLQINRNGNKAEVVRTKILNYFFSGRANVSTTFVDIATKTMPNVIEWIGRDYSGFSVMYDLFRSMPWLISHHI